MPTDLFDFETGIDEIRLDARFMPALGASGDFTASDPRFRAGTTAQDADDRIIFDAASGNIWYDADGSGASGQLLIATPESGTVVATDFAVENGGTTTPPDGTNGTEGNDTMIGTADNDSVEGRTGNERLTGGSGQDAFVFREFGAANADTITDFSGNNWDRLHFDDAAFTALGGDGRFRSGDARFRAGAAQLVATLQAGATLVASDMWVI